MQRARLMTLAAVGAMAAALLTGCKSEPTVAAYVGSDRITDAHVESVVDSASAKIRGDATQQRDTVLGLEVFLSVAKRYADEKGWATPSIDYAGVATSINLPEDNEFVRAVAETDAYLKLLSSNIPPAAPSDADLQAMYQHAIAEQLATPGHFSDFTDAIQPFMTDISAATGVRNELAAAAKRYGVTVNPRVAPVEMTLYGIPTTTGEPFTAVALSFPAASAPVRDISA
jgi:hypothetical protein